MKNYFYTKKLYTTPSELAKLLGLSVQYLHKFNKQEGINTLTDKTSHKIFPNQAREILQKRGLSYPKVCVHFHNQKGGSGKTTLSHATSLKAASLGFKVLAIDIDPQANLSRSFGHKHRANTRPNFGNLVFKEFQGKPVNISDTIVKLDDNFDLIPSDQSMSNFDLQLVLKSAGSGVNKIFEPLFNDLKERYDVIVIDSPPNLNSTTLGATFNCNKLIIPTEPEESSIDGASEVFEQLRAEIDDSHGVQPFVLINKASMFEYDLIKVMEIMEKFGKYVMESNLGSTLKFKQQIEKDNVIWNYSVKQKPEYISLLENAVFNILDVYKWTAVNDVKHNNSPMIEANV